MTIIYEGREFKIINGMFFEVDEYGYLWAMPLLDIKLDEEFEVE